MLACYYSQGKQLTSGVIGLLTCQSHCNVSVINTTPCARLLLRHPLDQRIARSPLTCTAFTLTCFLITHTCHCPHISVPPGFRGPFLRQLRPKIPDFMGAFPKNCNEVAVFFRFLLR